MRTIGIILRKEFRQIFRNKTMLPLIFVLPFVQLLILVNAATMDMKHIKMILVDKDLSSVSRQIKRQIPSFTFFHTCWFRFFNRRIRKNDAWQ